MNSKKNLEPFLPPQIEFFLKEKYWAIHEAAFVFTEWPKYNVCLASTRYTKGDLEINRSFIYLPENLKIDSKSYGSKFKEIYTNLIESIENGKLQFKTCLLKGVIFLVQPSEVITWALLKGYILSPDLQKAIGIRQDTSILELSPKTQNSLSLKVRQKITAQLLLSKEPHQTRTQLCQNVLQIIQKTGRDFKANDSMDLTTVRKNINELFEEPGKRGRKPEENKFTDTYIRRPIKEVLKIDSNGNTLYNFPLFKEAMLTAVNFKIDSRKNMSKINKETLLKEFLEDDVIGLYLQQHEYISRIITSCVDQALSILNWIRTMEKIGNQYSEKGCLKIKDGNVITLTVEINKENIKKFLE